MRKTNILLSPLGLRTSPLRISTYQRTFFGHAPTRRGTILSSQQIFILSREGLAGGASG